METVNPDGLVIHTHDLSKTYRAGRAAPPVVALKSLDLQVPRHSIFGFIGPNGAGKTTTIKLLLGLARPSAGRATVLGHDVVQENLDIRQRIGYLPQAPHFYDHMTARQTLRFKARFFYSGPPAAIENRVREMLALVGLSEKADRPVKGFSGGEKQRLGIAQAMINYPDLLILDEPAASLDPLGRRDVLSVMKQLRERTTIFYSTHILDDVQQVSDTAAILHHGEILAQAPLQELLAKGAGRVYALTLRGDARAAHARVAEQNWVSSLSVSMEGDQTQWEVSVTDEAAAQAQLLRLVLEDPRVSVIEFKRKKYELEDVFVDIVGEGQHGR